MKRISRFIELCLPSLAFYPPSGSGWIHEIKHDGFRLMACRDAVGVRLLTRNGNDFTARYPLIELHLWVKERGLRPGH
jgi:bifunctional non-homologous end joining protein LigD